MWLTWKPATVSSGPGKHAEGDTRFFRRRAPDVEIQSQRQNGTEYFSTQALGSTSGTSFAWRSRRNVFTGGSPSLRRSESGDFASISHQDEDPPPHHQPALDGVLGVSVDSSAPASSMPPAVATGESRSAPPPLAEDPSPVLGGEGSFGSSRAKEHMPVIEEEVNKTIQQGRTSSDGQRADAVFEREVPDNSSSSNRRQSPDGFGVVEVVVEAAHELATHSVIPGVSEAARLVSILVRLVTDH